MPNEPNDRGEAPEGLDYVTQVRENTRRYVDELRAENDRLKLLVSSLESERVLLESRIMAVQSELDLQVSERSKLLERVHLIEGEQQSYAQDHAEIEEQNNNLASLYVATYGLHGTLNRAEVISVIKEIVANLIGSEEMAVFELGTPEDTLELVASQGVEVDTYRSLPKDSGLIWKAVERGATFVADDAADDEARQPYEQNLTACVPLKIDGKVTGAIALFRLLGHKPGLEPLDFELFDLLARQAAIALKCTSLFEASRGAVSAVDK